jgi:hypothetical protein
MSQLQWDNMTDFREHRRIRLGNRWETTWMKGHVWIIPLASHRFLLTSFKVFAHRTLHLCTNPVVLLNDVRCSSQILCACKCNGISFKQNRWLCPKRGKPEIIVLKQVVSSPNLAPCSPAWCILGMPSLHCCRIHPILGFERHPAVVSCVV